MEKLKIHLTKDENGCCETSFIWKEGQNKQKNNEAGRLGSLKTLGRNHQQGSEKFEAYDDIIKAQIEDGITQRAQVTPDAEK